jgi:hypothetical protein
MSTLGQRARYIDMGELSEERGASVQGGCVVQLILIERESVFEESVIRAKNMSVRTGESIQRLNIESETLNFNILNLNRTKYI